MNPVRSIIEPSKRILVETFSGSKGGKTPQWQLDLEQGHDGGYFAPGSSVWIVNGDMAPIVGGIRALLMQALHPGALAGVRDHSNYKEDPLKRLANTIRWIFTVTYGSTETATQASNYVRRLHESVVGTYMDGHGVEQSYAANDPELAKWIHIAFTDAFLAAHKTWGRPIPGGPDAYVREWAQAGELMGVVDPPRSEAEMATQLEAWRAGGFLRSDEAVAETVHFIRHPPLHPLLKIGYPVLFAAAVSSLEPQYRTMLGLREARIGPVRLPVRAATRMILKMVHLSLGKVGASETSALARRKRLGLG